jgi:hypothetical protein
MSSFYITSYISQPPSLSSEQLSATVVNMGQDQSSLQPLPFKSEPSSMQCFHQIDNTDANLTLLREKNIWVGADLATQSQEVEALPANLPLANQFSNFGVYEERQFYCEGCFHNEVSKLCSGGFATRCVQKDDRMVLIPSLVGRLTLTSIIRSELWIYSTRKPSLF